MSSEVEDTSLLQEESEDDFDWEEVEVPEHQAPHLEITLQAHPNASKGKGKQANKKKGIDHAERLVRIDCHKIHTIALIANARVRNKWINDSLLHARLLSLVPLHLQNAFGYIHKSRIPDQNQRGRMFERAMGDLTDWWANTYFEVLPEGHIRNHTFDDIQRRLEVRGLHVKNEDDPDAILELDTLEDILDADAEIIRSEKSLMKHTLMASGSRDVSAQLFTALCRGLGIPARLVVSIQSVPWQASVGKPKANHPKKPKLKGKEYVEPEGDDVGSTSSKAVAMAGDGQRLDGAPVPKTEKAKGKQKAKPAVNLRKTKTKGNKLGTAGPSKLASPDPLTTPPVFWTEVFSRPDSRWLPVDPIRAIVNKRKAFDPTPSSTAAPAQPSVYSSLLGINNTPVQRRVVTRTRVENRMVYVLAFEEDGYARDVTRRYAREYGAKVAKMQGGSNAPNMAGGGKGRRAWWDRVVKAIERPYRLHRDDLEDQELDTAQLMEGMPTTMSGFKDHPLYILARHLKQTETLHHGTTELGKFRGEAVYPRSAVVSLKTSENWMRSTGRSVKAGEQPMKMVKVRAGTVNKMRELEVLKDELRVAGQDDQGQGSSSAGDEIMQGLYAFSQTEPYIPDPVVDGKVPKNNFGNIDLYVPSMLPKGGVHIPFKGVAKIARKLGFDFAEAVTGFEFKKRRAFPVIEGIVVAAENEEAILEAYQEAEAEAEEKARIKKEDRVLKHWVKLIHGLRIRQRLQDQYGTKSDAKKPSTHTKKDATTSTAPDVDGNPGGDSGDKENPDAPHDDEYLSDSAGGFLAGADRVVQAFHLPKNTHVVLPESSSTLAAPSTFFDKHEKHSRKAKADHEVEDEDEVIHDPATFVTYDLDEMDVDGTGAFTTPANASEDEDNMDMEEVITADESGAIPMSKLALTSTSRSTPASVGTGTASDKVPLTMQQLVEDATRQEELDRANGKGEVEEISLPSEPALAHPQSTKSTEEGRRTRSRAQENGKAKAKVTLTIPASRSTPTSGRASRTRATRPSASAASSRNATKSSGRKAAPATRRSSKRKRFEESESDLEEEEDDEDEVSLQGDDHDDDVEDDLEDEEEMEEVASLNKPSPRKRARASSTATPKKGRAKPKPAPPAPSTSTRTLRPRTSKTAAQLAEEKEREQAFRRAVAE
ncbi:Rad4-domain-containing protein [Agrocybe pediades]|nr:Rad4-domain-containing protein [Agrocybe pediades]